MSWFPLPAELHHRRLCLGNSRKAFLGCLFLLLSMSLLFITNLQGQKSERNLVGLTCLHEGIVRARSIWRVQGAPSRPLPASGGFLSFWLPTPVSAAVILQPSLPWSRVSLYVPLLGTLMIMFSTHPPPRGSRIIPLAPISRFFM